MSSSPLRIRWSWVPPRSEISPASFSFLAAVELAKDAVLGRLNEVRILPNKARRLKTS